MYYYLSLLWVDGAQLGASHLGILVELRSDGSWAGITWSLHCFPCPIWGVGQHGRNSWGPTEHLSMQGLSMWASLGYLTAWRSEGHQWLLPKHLAPQGECPQWQEVGTDSFIHDLQTQPHLHYILLAKQVTKATTYSRIHLSMRREAKNLGPPLTCHIMKAYAVIKKNEDGLYTDTEKLPVLLSEKS